MKSTLARIRPLLAVGVVAVGLTACDSVMSAINVFLMSFYDGGGSTSLIAPSGVKTLLNLVAFRQAAARSASPEDARRTRAALTDLVKNYVEDHKSEFGVNLAYGLGADNTGNTERAELPGKAALDLFVQSRKNSPLTAALEPFAVDGGVKDTINCNFPVTLDKIPEASVNSILKGDSIPYFLRGKVGYDLKSPSGNVLSSHSTEMDIATRKLATRPSDDQTRQFLDIAKEYL